MLKSLSLDVTADFGSVKSHFKSRKGRQQLQKLIYHRISIGVINEDPVGTLERPSIRIVTGNIESLQNGTDRVCLTL